MLIPYLDLGNRHRLPVVNWLRASRLPEQLHEDPDLYIPATAGRRFLSLMANETGRQDLGLRVAMDMGLELMGPRVVAGVQGAPSLERGITEFAGLLKAESGGESLRLSRCRGTAYVDFVRTLESGAPGSDQTEWQNVILLMKAVQLFTGHSWRPQSISMRSSQAALPLASELLPGVLFMMKQDRCFISFSEDLLSLPPRIDQVEAPPAYERLETGSIPTDPPDDFPGSVRQILMSYLRDGCPSVDQVAEVARISSRTLQRRLSECGFSFSRLLAEARFELATRLLTQTDATSLEIACETGYEDQSNFARAFRRLAGCSPREYRHEWAAGAN